MPTLQSRWARYNATPGAHQRRQRAPLYPPMAPQHGDWLGGCINGHTVIMRLMRDRAHRCDQWAAEVDGDTIADAAGLTRLWCLLHQRWSKATSLRAMASAQRGELALDWRDADAALAPAGRSR